MNDVHAKNAPRKGVVTDKPQASPKFNHPPVVEVVLGVQFAPLQDYRDVHAGVFWATRLGKNSWPKVRVAPSLRSAFERFGTDEQWGEILPFEIRSGGQPDRTQFLNEAEDRMIQVQNTRFHYNWVRKSGEYPSYEKLLPEFQRQLEGFRAFCAEEGLGEIKSNQWEITYVNHIPAGSLWSRREEWTSLFPWLQTPASNLVTFDSVSGTWRLVIGENRGRLHVEIRRAQHAKLGDVLVLNLTARGPLSEEREETLEGGLGLGHDAIVFSFAEMTSETAHQEWGRHR